MADEFHVIGRNKNGAFLGFIGTENYTSTNVSRKLMNAVLCMLDRPDVHDVIVKKWMREEKDIGPNT